ncbi:MAG: TPM domain-containing protein [Bacteroidota bacterium]
MNHKTILSESERTRLVDAIKRVEETTIAEIKIHIDNLCKDDVLVKAASVFASLGMDKTTTKTGVLIYVACQDRKMAILADSNIHQKVKANYWDDLVAQCINYMKQEKYFEGLNHVLHSLEKDLSSHFPSDIKSENPNEISNDLSFGEDE